MMLGHAALMIAIAIQSTEAQSFQDIQRKHIEDNVPPAADFNRILQRDLGKHFTGVRGKKVHVEFEMLREGPTQSGVAYPKFYVWVRVFEGRAKVDEGAVRLSAMAQKTFDVTDFVSAREIQTDPEIINRVFPGQVCARIRTKLDKRK